MIMTVAEYRSYFATEESDPVLEARLQALELMIRAYTNNNFQNRAFRAVAVAVSEGNRLLLNAPNPFRVGDTLEITDCELNNGLVTVEEIDGNEIVVRECLNDEGGVVLTKVVYPNDIKMGIANLLKWEIDNREKVGVSSETISRHSITYFDQTANNSVMGYPASLMGFLKPYKKARFGRGIRV